MKACINGRLFDLPVALLYKNLFLEYMQDDVIYIDEPDLEKRYQKTRLLFDYVCNSFLARYCTMLEEDYFKFSEEVKKINKDSSDIDNQQMYCYETGKVEKAIEIMNNFMEEMLDLHEYILNDEKQTLGSR